MILILGYDNDISSNQVIDWICIDFMRVNEYDFISQIDITLNESQADLLITLNTSIILDSSKIFSYWYRRCDYSFNIQLNTNFTDSKIVKPILQKEWDTIKYLIHNKFERNKSFGSSIREAQHNKLYTLLLAQSLGILIPDTLITNSKANLKAYHDQQNRLISKSCGGIFRIENNIQFQTIGTQAITMNVIDSLSEFFFPTFVQKKIEKVYELRIFYMKNQFYPMAIFSQNDEKTQLDYRNYNREKPNRNVPYILPEEIKIKLQLLMDKLDLDSGSIDMIVTPEGEYVFLEVNPTGQFGWVSENCNYYLEEKIANYLQGES